MTKVFREFLYTNIPKNNEEQENEFFQLLTYELINLTLIIFLSFIFNYKITIPIIVLSAISHTNLKVKYDVKYESKIIHDYSSSSTRFFLTSVILIAVLIYFIPYLSDTIQSTGIIDKIVSNLKYICVVVFFGFFFIPIYLLEKLNMLHKVDYILGTQIIQPLTIYFLSKFVLYTLFSRLFFYIKNSLKKPKKKEKTQD
ncbi:MAG: hypothetical protein ACRCZW_11705 [Lactobacillaceae bacterium]